MRNFAAIICLGLSACTNPFEDKPRAFSSEPYASIGAPALRSFVDGKFWVLERELVYREFGREIRVPAGFITDLASIPSAAELFRSRVGTYNRAAILHDWLYWTGYCTQKEADLIFYRAMKSSGTPDVVAWQVYRGVWAGGWRAYERNERVRSAEADSPGNGERRLVDLTAVEGKPEAWAALDNYYWADVESSDQQVQSDRKALLAHLPLIASPKTPERPEWCIIGRAKE